MASYDYRATPIKCNGELVIRTTVVGLAAEEFLRLAIHDRLGFHALRADFVTTVTMRDCYVDGTKAESHILVAVPREASDLAKRIARQSVEALESSGFRVLDAIRPQFDAGRNKAGEHDIVGERRDIPCGRRGGLSSVDLKVRVITHPHLKLQEFRNQLRRSVAERSKLWAACCAPQPEGLVRGGGRSQECWAERLVLMVQLRSPDATDWDMMRCEAIANAKGATWAPLFGWGVAVKPEGTRARGAVTAAEPAAAQALAPLRVLPPGVSRKRPAAAAFVEPPSLETIWNSPSFRKTTYRRQEYGSVSGLCTHMNTGDSMRKKNHVNVWVPKWADSFGWPGGAWKSVAELGSKAGGGSQGAGATFSACQDIFNQCNRP